MVGAAELDRILDGIRGLRVAVLGDVMLDRFVFGRVERISPEAPVPVVAVRSEDERLGGAGNVAANVASLGAEATLLTVIGHGEQADALFECVASHGLSADGIVSTSRRLTSVKTRILANGQQVVRIDRESNHPLEDDLREELFGRMESLGPFDAYIVSDYGKGIVHEALMERMRAAHDAGIPVIVDPKQGNFELYRGVSCITPNAKEAGDACHRRVDEDADAEAVAVELQQRLSTDWMLITRGEHGMTLRDGDGRVSHIPTRAREVFDVTGAGDTVIASFACACAAGASCFEAAQVANGAAGQVVREIGTASIRPEELRAFLLQDGAQQESAHGG